MSAKKWWLIAILFASLTHAYDTGQFAQNQLRDGGCAPGATKGLEAFNKHMGARFRGGAWPGSTWGYVKVRTDSVHCAGRAVDWFVP